MKTYFAPIKGSNGRSHKITIPTGTKLAKLYQFEQHDDGTLVYSPVIKDEVKPTE